MTDDGRRTDGRTTDGRITEGVDGRMTDDGRSTDGRTTDGRTNGRRTDGHQDANNNAGRYGAKMPSVLRDAVGRCGTLRDAEMPVNKTGRGPCSP